MTLKVKRVRPGAQLSPPRYPGDVGYDLHACLDGDVMLPAWGWILICTGVSVQLPDGYEGQVRPRSGLSQLGLVATLGTIDTHYRGEIKVVLRNLSGDAHELVPGMRVAQLVISPVRVPRVEYVEELGVSERGGKGFGSSGV